MTKTLSALVALLALAVGALHFALDFVLFRGNFFGLPAPPAGAPRPSPPPGPPPGFIATLIGPRLPQLFLANFILYVLLAIAFLAVSRARTNRAAICDRAQRQVLQSPIRLGGVLSDHVARQRLPV